GSIPGYSSRPPGCDREYQDSVSAAFGTGARTRDQWCSGAILPWPQGRRKGATEFGSISGQTAARGRWAATKGYDRARRRWWITPWRKPVDGYRQGGDRRRIESPGTGAGRTGALVLTHSPAVPADRPRASFTHRRLAKLPRTRQRGHPGAWGL